MKTVKLNILDVRRTNEGGIAFKTKATSFNESQTEKGFAWHRLTPKQTEYFANLSLGMKSPQALFAAIMKSRGQAVVEFQVKTIKAGETWINEFTAETGTYQLPDGKTEVQRGSVVSFEFADSVYDVMFSAAISSNNIIPVIIDDNNGNGDGGDDTPKP